MGIQSNQEDWHELYKEWADRFLLFARQQTRNPADAEDLFQEAFVLVWGKRHILPRIEPGLVFTHIRRLAIDRSRRDGRRERRESEFASANCSWFVPPEMSGQYLDLEQSIRKLPAEQQEVLVLKVWGDQTFESIGKALDISPNTAASRFRYGLEQLKRELDAKETP